MPSSLPCRSAPSLANAPLFWNLRGSTLSSSSLKQGTAKQTKVVVSSLHSGKTVVRRHRHCTEITRAGVRPPRHRSVSVMSPCGHILTQYEEQEGGDRTPRRTIDLATPI